MPARRKRAASTAATPEPSSESTLSGGTIVKRGKKVRGRTANRNVSVFGKRPTKDPMALVRYTIKKEIQRAEKQLDKLHSILDNLD
jgi:hypothetical protein